MNTVEIYEEVNEVINNAKDGDVVAYSDEYGGEYRFLIVKRLVEKGSKFVLEGFTYVNLHVGCTTAVFKESVSDLVEKIVKDNSYIIKSIWLERNLKGERV